MTRWHTVRAARRAASLGAAALAAAAAFVQSGVRAGLVPARRADDFVDTIGVATHWNYPDTPYGFAYEKVRDLLGASGIRHVRDGWHERIDDLHRRFGITAIVLSEPDWGPPAKQLELWRRKRHAMDMIEGPNEVNLFWPGNKKTYRGKAYPEGSRFYQQDLYKAVKGDPATKGIPVIALSTAFMGKNLDLAPLDCFDHLVMHSYAGGGMPSLSLAGPHGSNVVNAGLLMGRGATLKRIAVTESGYHNALGSSKTLAEAQPGVSERAHAKYILRHFAEYWNAGVVRTVIYEFINEFPDPDNNAEANFGMVRRDCTPKPAYHATKNLIALLGEAKWDAEKQTWDRRRFKPRALGVAIREPSGKVHHSLLQKSTGEFYLLLWQEVPSFDTRAKRDVENADARVTVRFGSRVEEAEAFLPCRGTDAVERWGPRRTLRLRVPDEVLVLRIRPRDRGASGAERPRAPARVKAEGATHSATLTWKAERGTAAYAVSRLGRRHVEVPPGPDGTCEFRDEGLQPALGYTYEVVAIDEDGNVSAPATVVARTRDAFPDLVVADILWRPERPKAGDRVTLGAVIRNKGNAATPVAVHGVAFHVDGEFVSWSDTSKAPLGPGESRTVWSNNGPKGRSDWPHAAGEHALRAHIDDVNRITESDEKNNVFEKKMR